MDGHTVSPFDLSRTLPVGGGLLVPYSLPGPPFVKQFIRMVTREPGQVGGISQCASPTGSQLSKLKIKQFLSVMFIIFHIAVWQKFISIWFYCQCK